MKNWMIISLVLIGCLQMVMAATQISDCAGLQAIKDDCDASACSGTYELTTDLNCGPDGENYEQTGSGFDPIGYIAGDIWTYAFTGMFDGQNHTLTGLYINRPSKNGVGLFGQLYYGTIKNVGLINVNITGQSNVGGLVGENDWGSVSNSYTNGTVNGTYNVGGLLGWNNGNVTNSNVTGQVKGTGNVGGLIGYNYEDSIITNSHAVGQVNGTGDYVGGLIGQNVGRVNSSYAVGQVTGTGNYYVGGLAGYNAGSVSNSYAVEQVKGSSNVGGLVGGNLFSGSVSNSYANGTVNGSNSVGGLIGNSWGGSVNNSYATGQVTGNYHVGGLVGYNDEESVSNSYATGQVKGTGNVGGLIGYNWEGSVSNSYATGKVNGTGSNVGGLIGYDAGSVSNSYWDICRTNQTTSDGGTGVNNITNPNDKYFYNMSNAPMNVWTTPPWSNIYNNTGYQPLSWEQNPVPRTSPACTQLTVCGNGIVETGEQCEINNTPNNINCIQSTQQCVGSKTQIRDSYGNCDASCGCVYDNWGTAQCVQSSCESQCDGNEDCPGQTCNLDICKCQGGGTEEPSIPEFNNTTIVILIGIIIVIGVFLLKKK